MLLKVYNVLKARLEGITGVKHIDWFNDQYEGIIHIEPGIFIDFPEPINLETLRGETQQGKLITRIHVYSKVIAMQDKSLNQEAIERHFEIVKEVFRRLQGFRSGENGKLLFNSMMRVNLTHHQYMQGWFVTTQDFESIVYDIEEKTTIAKPPVEIIT